MDFKDESTAARIERLVTKGNITREAVVEAEALWKQRLQYGVLLPNGETARIMLDDLYHLIVDDRIWRKLYRIERILVGIFEIRTADNRRIAFSRWNEGDQSLIGYAILTPESRVWTMHLIDERGLRRLRRRGELIWEL